MAVDFDRHLSVLKSYTCLSKLSQPLCSLLEDLNSINEVAEIANDLEELINLLCKIASVREFPYDLNRDFEEKDFKGFSPIVVKCFQCLNLIFEKTNYLNNRKLITIYEPIILLCGTHHQLFLWSNKECVQQQKSLLGKILLHEGLDNLSNLLIISTSDKTTLVQRVLDKLKPSLTREKWKRNPSSPQIFKWLLLSIPYQFMPKVIPDLIPPILLFLDDFQLENQLLGIECTEYLIKNSPITMLTWNGLSEVYYSALFRLTYSKETDIIDRVYSCLLLLISGLEKDANRADRNKKPGKLDQVYGQLLRMAEMESKLNVIDSYSKLLPVFIDKLGITILRHFQRTLRVIFEYLSTYKGPNEQSRILVLKALQNLIIVAWPRIENHAESIVKVIARLLYDISSKEEFPKRSKETNEILINECKKCLILLRKSCPETFKELVIPLQEIADQVPTAKIFIEINNLMY